jgi:hypothetical protein
MGSWGVALSGAMVLTGKNAVFTPLYNSAILHIPFGKRLPACSTVCHGGHGHRGHLAVGRCLAVDRVVAVCRISPWRHRAVLRLGLSLALTAPEKERLAKQMRQHHGSRSEKGMKISRFLTFRWAYIMGPCCRLTVCAGHWKKRDIPWNSSIMLRAVCASPGGARWDCGKVGARRPWKG